MANETSKTGAGTLIVTKGSLDRACLPSSLATTAAAWLFKPLFARSPAKYGKSHG